MPSRTALTKIGVTLESMCGYQQTLIAIAETFHIQRDRCFRGGAHPPGVWKSVSHSTGQMAGGVGVSSFRRYSQRNTRSKPLDFNNQNSKPLNIPRQKFSDKKLCQHSLKTRLYPEP